MKGVTWLVADSRDWLRDHHDVGSIVTSPADANEMGMDPDEYPSWLYDVTQLLLRATSDTAPTILFVTDRKAGGQTISKAGIVLRAAHDLGGHRVLWHKIALRRMPGKTDLHRPGYTHVLSISRRAKPGAATPDIIAPGPRLYPNANDLNSARVAIDAARRCSDRMVDPFCGRGTLPVLAAHAGLHAIGIDIDAAQIARARALRISGKHEVPA